MKTSRVITRLTTTCLALALGGILAASRAVAVPYASRVVKSGNNVTFILNHAASGMTVLLDGTTPATVTPGPATPGLQSFDMTGYSTFVIYVTNYATRAWSQFIPDDGASDRNFYTPTGISIDKNPASPNFGKVFVSNATSATTAAGRNTPEGIYVLNPDGTAVSGPHTGGVTWGGTLGPWKSTIGPDGHLYVTDLSNDLCYEMSPDLQSATQLIDASNKSASQYVASMYVTGTQAGGDRKIYLVSSYYANTHTGVKEYSLGANATATSGDTGTQMITRAPFNNYYPYDIARDSDGNWYVNSFRSTTGQASPIVKFNGAGTYTLDDDKLWSASNTYAGSPSGIDINEDAGIVAYVAYDNGVVRIFSMETGAFIETFTPGTGNRGRDLAFDAAGNLVIVNSSSEYARYWSPGGNTVAVTGSDGTFTLVAPGTVTVAATDNQASEAGPDTGTFRLTRTSTGGDLTVYYAMTGTATSNVDYTISPTSPVTIPAGQETLDITVTPVAADGREPSETAILTIQASGTDYSVGSPSSATVTITDNDATPRYWDGNGDTAGAGSTPTGTWGTDSFWNAAADGTGTPGAWGDWNQAVFSAGTDASGSFAVTLNGTLPTDGPIFEEGSVTLTGGSLLLTNFSGVQVADTVTATVESVITGVNGMTKTLPGTLVLKGANDYSGNTTVSAGTVKLGAANVIPNGSGKGNVSVGASGTLDLGGFSETINGLSSSGTVDSSGSSGTPNILTLGDNNVNSSFSGSIKDSGTDIVGWTKIGTGTFTFGGGATHTYSGDTTLSAGTVSVNDTAMFGDGTGTLRLAGGSLMITATRAAASSFLNPVAMTADTVLKCSSAISGTWYMRFTNSVLSFTGGTLTITNQGTSGTFIVQFNTVVGTAFARPIILSAGARLELDNEDNARLNDAVVSGPVTGAGQVNYTSWNDATGGNTLATNGNNTYSGGSQLTGGFLGFGADSTGPAGAPTAGPIGTGSLTINNDGELGMFAWGAPRTIGNAIIFGNLTEANALWLDGTNNLTFTGPVSLGVSNRTFMVTNSYPDTVGGVHTFAGAISGGAADKFVYKDGPGTLAFGGNNTYSGSTQVKAGTLLVNNTTGSGTSSGAVTVDSGATLGGSGTIAGPVSVAYGAFIAPGQSAGLLTFQGGLDLNTYGGSMDWQLAANSTSNPGTDFDQVAVTGGDLLLNEYVSVLKIGFTNNATVPDLGVSFWKQPRQWRIMAFSGGGTFSGNFYSIEGTNDITAGTFTTTVDANGVNLVYTPSVVVPPDPEAVTGFGITNVGGGTFTLGYSGGVGEQFVLLQTNNVAAPLANWTRLQTNTATPGFFTITPGAAPRQFYRIISE